MTIIDEYISTLDPAAQALVTHLYQIVRTATPDREERLSYNMPAVMYKGKGLVAIMQTKHFLSLYPFCNHESLQLGNLLQKFETTKGSIHFSVEQPLPDNVLLQILEARKRLIDGGY